MTPASDSADARAMRAPVLAGVVLLAIYAITLAPGVTFWDSGEFIAAIDSFGVPHPPGTPLFVLLGRAWRLLLPFLPTALATNLFSAVCSATACTIGGMMLARHTRRPTAAAAGALAAGLMSSVWLNATETEVYSASLLLSALMLWAASHAEESDDPRWTMMLGFFIALAAPLHASALVAAPAAILLAARWTTTGSAARIGRGVDLLATFIAAAAVATGRWTLAICAATLLVALAVRNRDARRLLVALVIGVSPLALLWMRARFDPAINQGNPSTIATMLDVIARKQYLVAGPWPRQAPVWLQSINVLEYVDWQVALGLAPGPSPHAFRTPLTVAFLALGWQGARCLRRDDAKTWRTILALVLCASVGVMLYLNLKAGPSLGWGILPDGAPHEARERDYFFVLAFWGWGLLAGYGAVRLMDDALRLPAVLQPMRRRHAVGVVLAMSPALLNFRAVNRRREPDASAPRLIAERLLGDAPRSAVLFVGGDNDTYPLWFAQQALGVRRDVLVVTVSLLAAPWYRAEMERRDSLEVRAWQGEDATVAHVAAAAHARGRPVVFSPTISAATRPAAMAPWRLCGAVWVENSARCTSVVPASLEGWLVRRPVSDVTDPTTRAMLRPLRCPGLAIRSRSSAAAADSLDSVCNAR